MKQKKPHKPGRYRFPVGAPLPLQQVPRTDPARSAQPPQDHDPLELRMQREGHDM